MCVSIQIVLHFIVNEFEQIDHGKNGQTPSEWDLGIIDKRIY
jgi:hypothetical protein